MDIPKFKTQKELFDFLKKNEENIIYEKKCQLKKGDGNAFNVIKLSNGENIAKADGGEEDGEQIKVRAVINTTMVMDSHKDVHIDNLWKKSLKENKMIKHLQEHDMSFKSIIADKDDLKVFARKMDWRDLGVDADGKTQALIFDSNVKKSRNDYMYGQYKDGNVDNHSVGMQYVTIKLAINSDEDEDERYKAVFDEHIDDILNKDEVIKQGYYYAIYEAKVREGSAVPLGSNQITPTISAKSDFEQTDKTDKADDIINWIRG